MVNETIVKASQDTGASNGVKKCAEIVFNRGRRVKAKSLYVLPERMKALDPEQNKNYKFLECEQAEPIDTDAVYERVKAEMDKKMKALTLMELYGRNLIKTINTRVVSVTSYVMDVCEFNQKQIDDPDKLIKKALRDKGMRGGQANDERLYLQVEG